MPTVIKKTALLILTSITSVFSPLLCMDLPITASPTMAIREQFISLRRLCLGSYDTLPLYANKADLPHSYHDLKPLFERYNLDVFRLFDDEIFERTDNEWKRTYMVLQSSNQKEKRVTDVELHELSPLLEDAKRVLKSFLPIDDREIPTIIKDFRRKGSMGYSPNRLFTYSYLNLAISIKKLTHIKLPRKVLLIKNTDTCEYVSTEEAKRIIDETLKIYLVSSYCYHDRITVQVLFKTDNYNLEVFAHEESITGKGLSVDAMEELKVLCTLVPFDVGYGNIFWDKQGVATIIDTEYKGEISSRACSKLGRYPIDYSNC